MFHVTGSYNMVQGKNEKVSNVHEDQTMQRILGKAGDEIQDEITSSFPFVPCTKLCYIEMYHRRRLAAVWLLFTPIIRFPTHPKKS